MKSARNMIPCSLRDQFDQRAAVREWDGVMMLVSSEVRMPLLAMLWPSLYSAERPTALAEAVSGGDALYHSYAFLCDALVDVTDSGERAFDCEKARTRFNALPGIVRIYRGTVQAEQDSGELGVSWTLNEKVAAFFAEKHGRFRNRDSPPIILAMDIARDTLAGMLTNRSEDEVLVIPESI